ISEQDTGLPVGPVNSLRHAFAADQEHMLVIAGLDELLGDRQPVYEARTCGHYVECRSILRSCLLLDDARSGWGKELRSAGGHQHKVDLPGFYARVLDGLSGCFNSQRICGSVPVCYPSFRDPCSLDYPFVRGVDHLLKV